MRNLISRIASQTTADSSETPEKMPDRNASRIFARSDEQLLISSQAALSPDWIKKSWGHFDATELKHPGHPFRKQSHVNVQGSNKPSRHSKRPSS
ncbi:hypothetical protein CEXT_346731 [Caerostris extrusa]|uniref:Uncharacterized protein n=1 Tax=Caerostris extrusa TaxID=172846 RepID=A0AAV4P1M5_CAEEX|nr:hypothetical protein CEXT_346731 [Caerostris extrusa]